MPKRERQRGERGKGKREGENDKSEKRMEEGKKSRAIFTRFIVITTKTRYATICSDI